MLINKWNWRDAGIMYEAEASGAGAGVTVAESTVVETAVEPVVQTPAQLLAELNQTRAALKIANKEAGDRRKKLEEIDAAAKVKADAELSEVDKATKRATEAEQRLLDAQAKHKTTTIHAAIKLAAVTAGFVDPADAVALANLNGVEVDEEGNVTGATEAVKKLSTDKPHLLNAVKPPAPNINSSSGGLPPDMTEVKRQEASAKARNMYQNNF